MPQPFAHRASAGQALAEQVAPRVDPDTLLLALPRGGVPVAHEIAAAHDLALDLLLVCKLGVPGHEELAFGAIASGDARYVDEELCRQLGIDDQTIEAVTQREQAELRRRSEAYRGDRPQPDLSGRDVFLVDDGVATGATMQAGIEAVASQDPYRVFALDIKAPKKPLRGDAAFIKTDVTSDASVADATTAVRDRLTGCLASVIRLAAYYDFSGAPSELYDRITVEGSERMVPAAHALNTEQFVFSSTMLVHVPTEPGRPLSEDQPLEAQWEYPQSKVRAEDAIRAASGDLPTVLLRIAGV